MINDQKSGLNSPPSIDPNKGDDDSLQALGKFLLDEHNSYLDYSSTTSEKAESIDHQSPRKDSYDAPLKGESVQQRVAKVTASTDPLLEACQPLLRALSEMPEEMIDTERANILKQTLKNEINLFSVVCDEANISWKKMAIIRYCICTALDEAAHTAPWGLAAGWSQSNLLNHFEGDNDGGNKFFLLVGRLSMSPHEYADVLNILLRILGLGLEGRYSIIEDGDRQLTKIRQRLLTLIQSTKDTVPAQLSPHVSVIREQGKKRRLVFPPVRVSLLLGSIIVAGVFIWCKYNLAVKEGALQERLYALQNLNGLTKAAPVKQRLRLAILLKDEIQKQLVTVDESQNQSKVVFKSDSMFLVGSATVTQESITILKRVAHEIRRVNGRVVIVGHTDSMPIHTKQFPNNQVLSDKRAQDVAQILIAEGIPDNYIKIQGAGDSKPISSNNDSKGRALNRRVEIFVTY